LIVFEFINDLNQMIGCEVIFLVYLRNIYIGVNTDFGANARILIALV